MLDGVIAMTPLIDINIKSVVLKGDSDLIIGFMAKRYKPKKKELSLIIKQTWEVVKGWKTVKAKFLHVPRDLN